MRNRNVIFAFVTAVLLFHLTAGVSRLQGAAAQTYLILYAGGDSPSNVDSVISRAGGTLIYNYSQIGVIIARSDNLSFRARLMSMSNGIVGAVATTPFGVHLNDDAAAGPGEPASAVTLNKAVAGGDTLSSLQWDMNQIHVPEARAISGGSPSVVVGNIDTGLDFTHPDLATNVDFASSVSCLSGAPDPNPSAWQDGNGHGTHTAGTIAAAQNGLGIIGVAPNVRIATIKAATDEGVFLPEAVVCAFMWAGTHRLQVANSSYSADPMLLNCQNDPRQRIIWEAERRAIRFAVQNGTVVVSAVGNYSDELARSTQALATANGPARAARSVPTACSVIPGEMPGVIGVAANGSRQLKSFYSSFGTGITQVTAPGGDSVLQRTPAAPNGRVLSAWPASLASACLRQVSDCSVSPCAQYCYQQGTSMAAAHVAGVAALVASNGVTQPEAVAASIEDKADQLECPEGRSYHAAYRSIRTRAVQVCEGDASYNSFSGHGQVNALRAVSR